MNVELRWQMIEMLRRGQTAGLNPSEIQVAAALSLKSPGEVVNVRMIQAATGLREQQVRKALEKLETRERVERKFEQGKGLDFELTEMGQAVVAAMVGEG